MKMGYSLIYAIINFAILAGALYIIGRKLVPGIFDNHRQKIQDGLRAGEEAAENAKTLLASLDASNAAAEQECDEIRRNAEMTAEAEKQRAEEADQRAADGVKAARPEYWSG